MPEILVPIGGSSLAERALRYAVERFPTASITTRHISNPVHSVIAAETGGSPDAEEWSGNAQDSATAIHDDAAETAAEYEVEIETVTEVGRPSWARIDDGYPMTTSSTDPRVGIRSPVQVAAPAGHHFGLVDSVERTFRQHRAHL